MNKLIRVSTIPLSLNILLKGQLGFLNKYFNVIAVSGSGTDLTEVAEREGVLTHTIDMQRSISPFKDIVSLVKLFSFFKKEKPQIVHSITPKAGLLSMLAAKLAGVPIRMHTFTGLIFPTRTGLMQKILIQMDRLLCACATHIYPEGNGVKQDLITYKITNKPLKVIGNGNINGIDVVHFSANAVSLQQKQELKADLDIKNNDFVFVFIGRLVADKGINELVKAFSRFQTGKLLLVGPLETALDPLSDKTLAAISSDKNIISVGFQKDIRPYLAISNVLVFPSYREGFPNVPMQAGCFNLPSIVTDINGCNEIIKNELNGLIIPVKDDAALHNAMTWLFEDEELYQKLKGNARQMIVDRFEQTHLWALLLQEYQELLTKDAPIS
ncbi:glycosyltransferase family 4 protein [Mucilaginibacter sp. UR6-11]|uniref:glycosyltransferase family 4 protein n=1 Tax=Mucilaginibacter sp. UR6-11 TaxID=1435644 RepID=UPI001E3B988B|nr:glycosyltransferase family 4 protein [Mucilaginibacter sp. UR6-11]MCC8424870.1 glycosyltransferase family 4 protein [Mucilaginibacter sp. UR6-11]